MNRGIKYQEPEADSEPAQLSLTEAGRNTVVEYSFEFLEDFQEECPKCPKIPYFDMTFLRYEVRSCPITTLT